MSLAIAEELAQFSAELAGTDIPDGVRDSARWHLLDTLGALASRWRGGSASVVGTGTQTRPEAAALINGAFAQVLELDDKHGSSLARPGSSVVPAVLAAGEALDVSLDDALCAIVV
ncbi:MAG: MmgE/PrpD family protein, partial [Acidimicrobiaceae bacterium]|nr:MmgE/PrpD family protein [Acidimicrobiaceae bacterium]